MVSLITIILLVITNALSSMDVEYILGGALIGIVLEVLFVWYPLAEKDKWYKKTSYFKYLYKLLF